MRRRYLGLLLMGLYVMTFASPAPAKDRADAVAQWDFDVYLNDRKVGKEMLEVCGQATAEGGHIIRYELS